MQALYCGNLGQANAMVGQRILQEIGQTGIPVVNCANACATGATAFREAWMSIKAGIYDVVLAVGVEQMGKGLLGGTVKGNLINIEPDPEKIDFGMKVKLTYQDALGRKDKEGNSYLSYFFEPA